MCNSKKSYDSFGTDAVHAGQEPRKWNSKSVVPPITLSSTFQLKNTDISNPENKFVYSRVGNPTRECLEIAIAKLENAKHAMAFASGVAAITVVMQSCLKVLKHL